MHLVCTMLRKPLFRYPTLRCPPLGPPDSRTKRWISFQLLVAHDCRYPLSRYTCRATRVAADFLDFIAFCRCSTGVALHPLGPPDSRTKRRIWFQLCSTYMHKHFLLEHTKEGDRTSQYSCFVAVLFELGLQLGLPASNPLRTFCVNIWVDFPGDVALKHGRVFGEVSVSVIPLSQKTEQAKSSEHFLGIPPIRLGLSGRNSREIPERPRKRSQSFSWNTAGIPQAL